MGRVRKLAVLHCWFLVPHKRSCAASGYLYAARAATLSEKPGFLALLLGRHSDQLGQSRRLLLNPLNLIAILGLAGKPGPIGTGQLVRMHQS
jgi:hypothetical protein